MLAVKNAQELGGGPEHSIVARAGYEEEALPVSCFLSDAPDSPLRGTSMSSGSRTSSLSLSGHLVADRTSHDDVSLHDPREQPVPVLGRSSSVLNSKLAQLLEARRVKEAESIKTMRADHAEEIMKIKAAHRDALEMKDNAHRSVMDDMVAELQQLRLRLESATSRWEAAEDDASQLRDALKAEKATRAAAETELKCQLNNTLDRWEAAEEEAERLREELSTERSLREAVEAEQRSLHSMLEAELEAV